MKDCKAQFIAGLDNLNDDEVPSNPQKDVDTTLERAKKEIIQHEEMIATFKNFIEALGANMTGKEVLNQLKFISEGFVYKKSLRDSEYYERG
ncbi:hypothetical protein BWQ96_05759 [Gracilariopsis chorda]|uniref:Uncharacterized protein n=1 Tax=Gracilariopsis chorda TaxID=448386 RepID=A0A2V3IRY3_9FLOR|nr:hypothetical protein BWQ96_05759 [Gracilariopsis chorda]|eukprot:PXF44487.1 hypothetical protein BWQ96_05759 [Gracilariopsis chorda]